MKVPRLVGVVSLGLLDKLKKAENSQVKVLSLSDGIVEVDPVVVLTNVAHVCAAEITAESAAVNVRSTPRALTADAVSRFRTSMCVAGGWGRRDFRVSGASGDGGL